MIVLVSEDDNPPLSVTWAVMVCVPAESVDNEKKLSVAKNPSLLEVHWICELIVPCSGSLAEPENVTESPSVDSEPFVGELIETVGGEFEASPLTVIVDCLESDAPSESVTDAVMMCVPTDRSDLKNPAPVPNAPSLLEDHCIDGLRSPSLMSKAEAENGIESPC